MIDLKFLNIGLVILHKPNVLILCSKNIFSYI